MTNITKELANMAVLCYVEGNWAYFTTQPLSGQWGDDWNDAPYEHNAGAPYEWDDKCGDPKYEVVRVAWDGPFDPPCSDELNSPFSVEQINAGAIAWLRRSRYGATAAGPNIMAGTTLANFVSVVRSVGGNVYFPCECEHPQ